MAAHLIKSWYGLMAVTEIRTLHVLSLCERATQFNLLNMHNGKERKGCDVWPSMVSHTCTFHHPSTHTAVSSEHRPGAVGSHIAAAPGEQLGVRWLAQGSHLSCGIEGGREQSACYSFDPLTNPAGTKTRTHNVYEYYCTKEYTSKSRAGWFLFCFIFIN